jgi:hypothetical protein
VTTVRSLDFVASRINSFLKRDVGYGKSSYAKYGIISFSLMTKASKREKKSHWIDVNFSSATLIDVCRYANVFIFLLRLNLATLNATLSKVC